MPDTDFDSDFNKFRGYDVALLQPEMAQGLRRDTAIETTIGRQLAHESYLDRLRVLAAKPTLRGRLTRRSRIVL